MTAIRTEADAERHLLARELFGMRFGLERMRRLLTALGSPQNAFGAIHVVGTNGKSSTARMAAALLERAGVRTGTYLSPHLVRFAERIRIGDADLAPAAFAAAVERTARAARVVERSSDEPVTQFELLTAAALAEFAARAVEVAVVEAGLGGRYDATNVLAARVCVLTNVGLEHTRWLGPTVADIAREKLAVVPAGATLVCGPLHPDAEREVAALPAVEVVRVPPVAGSYQAQNLAVARAAAAAWLGRPVEGALELQVPGRLHRVAGRPETILDGAHNPAGIEALARVLAPGTTVVVGVLDDKDAAGMLRPLLPLAAHAVFTRPPGPRGLPPGTLASLWAQLGGGAAEVEPDPRAALERARSLAGPDGRVVATGSIHLVAELLAPPGARRASAL